MKTVTETFEDEMRLALNQGWQPLGNHCLAVTYMHRVAEQSIMTNPNLITISQLMVKYYEE